MTDCEKWEKKVADAPFPENMLADIEKFFREVHPRLKPGQLLYPEVFATDLFFPLQRQAELRRMMEIASGVGRTVCSTCEGHCIVSSYGGGPDAEDHEVCPDCKANGMVGGPKVVMEIGADKGGSLYHWCMLPTVERVIACEVRGTPYWHLFEWAFPEIDFNWIEKSSRDRSSLREIELYTLSPYTGPWPIDCLFIDGEKPKMYDDFVAYLPFMSRPGVVFVHDINDSYGRAAIERIRRDGYAVEEVIDYTEALDSMKREAQGVPPANSHEGWLRHWKGKSAGVGVVRLGADG